MEDVWELLGERWEEQRTSKYKDRVGEWPFPFTFLASVSSPIPCFSPIPLPHSQAVYPPSLPQERAPSIPVFC